MKGMLTLGDMGTLAIAFVIVAVIVGVGATILTQVQATQTANSMAYNITTDALSGQEDLGDWLPTVATIIGAACVLGVIYYFRA